MSAPEAATVTAAAPVVEEAKPAETPAAPVAEEKPAEAPKAAEETTPVCPLLTHHLVRQLSAP